MKSDIIHVTSKGEGMNEALKQADATSAFLFLEKKPAMHLRLLTEEMMSLITAMTGEKEADFWIEEKDGVISLHLKTITIMNSEKRSQLLSASTSGKNVAAKGVLGKIRDLLERTLEPADSSITNYYPSGWIYGNTDPYVTTTMVNSEIWSFNQYRDSIAENPEAEEWDELEKSIIGKLADEVRISILGDKVELTIFKSFKK